MRLILAILAGGIGAATFFSAQDAHAAPPACSSSQLAQMQANSSSEYHVTCTPNFSTSNPAFITRPLVFKGSASSNMVFNCGGGAIHGEIAIRSISNSSYPNGYDRAQNITIRSCNISDEVDIWNAFSTIDDMADVRLLQQTSPTNITFDLSTFNFTHNSVGLHIRRGVTYVTIKNSDINMGSRDVAVYMSPGSAWNTIEYTDFVHDHTASGPVPFPLKRETIAIDGSEGNTIKNNSFQGLEGGAVFLYRNCGEDGKQRFVPAAGNKIDNNTFYYNQGASNSNPGIFIGSRATAKAGTNTGPNTTYTSYCWEDGTQASQDSSDLTSAEISRWGSDWEGSSTDDRDFARNNRATGNRFCHVTPSSAIDIGIPTFNTGNVLASNYTEACSPPTTGSGGGSGCQGGVQGEFCDG